MRIKILNILTALLLIVCFSNSLKSQIAISNLSEIEKLTNGITYIAMKDPDSEISKEYIEVFKNNWTISEYEFIKYSEIENYLSPDNSFLTIGGYEKNYLYANGVRAYGRDYTVTHIYLELWTCDDEFFNQNIIKTFDYEDKIQIARIELFTDFETLSDPDKIVQLDYDGNGHIRNWGPGILKNYIQILTSYIQNGNTRYILSNTTNKEQLVNLETEVLYVPDYVLIKFNMFNGDETGRNSEKKLFKHYPFKYELISINELNNKIMTSDKPFYYLVYVKSSTTKYVSVINSKTGKLVYSEYTGVSYNLQPKDLKALQERVLGVK